MFFQFLLIIFIIYVETSILFSVRFKQMFSHFPNFFLNFSQIFLLVKNTEVYFLLILLKQQIFPSHKTIFFFKIHQMHINRGTYIRGVLQKFASLRTQSFFTYGNAVLLKLHMLLRYSEYTWEILQQLVKNYAVMRKITMAVTLSAVQLWSRTNKEVLFDL